MNRVSTVVVVTLAASIGVSCATTAPPVPVGRENPLEVWKQRMMRVASERRSDDLFTGLGICGGRETSDPALCASTQARGELASEIRTEVYRTAEFVQDSVLASRVRYVVISDVHLVSETTEVLGRYDAADGATYVAVLKQISLDDLCESISRVYGTWSDAYCRRLHDGRAARVERP
jgi:hypothetical protein